MNARKAAPRELGSSSALLCTVTLFPPTGNLFSPIAVLCDVGLTV